MKGAVTGDQKIARSGCGVTAHQDPVSIWADFVDIVEGGNGRVPGVILDDADLDKLAVSREFAHVVAPPGGVGIVGVARGQRKGVHLERAQGDQIL